MTDSPARHASVMNARPRSLSNSTLNAAQGDGAAHGCHFAAGAAMVTSACMARHTAASRVAMISASSALSYGPCCLISPSMLTRTQNSPSSLGRLDTDVHGVPSTGSQNSPQAARGHDFSPPEPLDAIRASSRLRWGGRGHSIRAQSRQIPLNRRDTPSVYSDVWAILRWPR